MLEECFSAQWTGGLVAGSEPFVQTCRVEFLFARAATFLGQGIVGAVDDREADHAILYSLETLIHVVLPQSQPLHYTAVLMCEVRAQLQHPVPPLLYGNAHASPTLYSDRA